MKTTKATDYCNYCGSSVGHLKLCRSRKALIARSKLVRRQVQEACAQLVLEVAFSHGSGTKVGKVLMATAEDIRKGCWRNLEAYKESI
jgi:predicted nuclease of restriction endonuclease-like RecB superfamily